MRGFGGELAHDLAELQKLQGGQKGLKNQVGKRQAQVIHTKKDTISICIYTIYIYILYILYLLLYIMCSMMYETYAKI